MLATLLDYASGLFDDAYSWRAASYSLTLVTHNFAIQFFHIILELAGLSHTEI